jgi:hypothetical protein
VSILRPSVTVLEWCLALLTTCTHGLLKSHQVPDRTDNTIELSEQEMEERSNSNVERWVSLHIIPVCGPAFIYEIQAHMRHVLFSRNPLSRFSLART